MQELIDRVAKSVGIDASVAQPAIAAIFGMLQKVLPPEIVSTLMNALPGAEDLAKSADPQSGAGGSAGGGLGGLSSIVTGALGSIAGANAGPLMETLGKLQGLGLSVDQSKAVGGEVLGYIKENAPAEVVTAIEQNLPELDK